MIRVAFVCWGNICRSTLSESVFTYKVKELGLEDQFLIDSFATSREEIGNPPHRGTVNKLREVGIPLVPHRAKQISLEDYDKFDYIIGMDEINIKYLNLYVHLGEAEGCTTSMKVKRPMIDLWEKAPDEVMEAALLNTYFISPPRIYCWEKMIFDPFYEGENFMDIMRDYPLRKDAVGNCLSTVKRTNGAVAVFLPGVAERLADLFQGGFYLVFTSIHEVMIHSEKTVDPKDLRRVLADTVRETTPEEDFLTFHIYYYDKDSGIFSLCLKGEEERD